MTKLVNRAKMSTATTGTGTITLGTAVAGFQSFAAAGVVDGDVVRYVIEDGTDFEIGTGTFGSAGGTLTRTVSESSNAGSPLVLTGNAVVFVGAVAADIAAAYANPAREVFTATAAQTTFTTNGYTVGYLDVYLNGVLLVNGTDYTATNGTDLVLASGATVGDVLTVIIFGEFSDGTIVTTDGVQTVTNKTMTAINYRETVGTIASGNLDLSTGNVFSDTPAANVTYVFSNPPASGTAYGFTLKVTPSAAITLTWPASVRFPGGVAPVAPASGVTDVFVFYTQDAGTNYFGFVAGEALA